MKGQHICFDHRGEKKSYACSSGKKIQEYLMCENRTLVMLLRIMKSRVISTLCVAVQAA